MDSARALIAAYEANPGPQTILGGITGLFRFGQGLHALQDFYAHSNYMEFQKPLIRVSGSYANTPLWGGEDYAGTTVIAHSNTSVTLLGLQSGFFGLGMPPGHTTHDFLNKDSASSPNGAVLVTRVVGGSVIGTQYQIVSGQNSALSGFSNAGFAPRHTLQALDSLLLGTPVFRTDPGEFKPEDEKSEKTSSISTALQALSEEPLIMEISEEITRIVNIFDGTSAYSIPWELIDPNIGIPFIYLASTPTLEPAATETPMETPGPFTPTPSAMVVPAATPTPDANFNRDGTVDQFDLLILIESWHKQTETSFGIE